MITKINQYEETVREGSKSNGSDREEMVREIGLRELEENEVVLVRGKKDSSYSIWKEMLEEHHYLHSSKLYGQQIKYLVRSSESGWIGALSFSSPAWRVKVRDKLLGWGEEERESG